MPQFDFAHVLVPQLAWLALFFAILYFGIVKATVPKLGRLIDERDGKVTGDISAAEQAKIEADRIHDAYETEMKQAHDSAHAAIDEAKAQAIRENEGKLHDASRALVEQQDKAFAALEVARARAMTDIEHIAVESSAEIVHRLSGVRPDEAAAYEAVRAALAA
jgi:F-type H+-transporting ATPase subunit b